MINEENPQNTSDEPAQLEQGHREMFREMFDQTTGHSPEQNWEDSDPTRPQRETAPPLSPQSLTDSGLTLMQVTDLALKDLYLHGSLLGVEIARHIRLPFPIVDDSLSVLKKNKAIEVTAGDVIGTASYQFNLTDLGLRRAKDAFEKCGYVGPAPVTLEQYTEQCRQQAVSQVECTPAALRDALEGMVVRDGLLAELGPAVCSGQSVFIYGPPGNGKTIVAKALGRFLNQYGGDIYVPYAIQVENSIITVLDPTVHQTTDDLASVPAGYNDPMSDQSDGRWRRVRRPVVITGGELTLDMLDLRFNNSGNFYSSPLHIKANGGVFLIDDFGRQLVSPRDLLNRWILPLEERSDYLTLATGKKIEVPFEQLSIFSTNLDPTELVDEAFLRRIRHKIRLDPPDRGLYTEIFQLACEERELEYNEKAVSYLFDNFYNPGRTPRASDPRDLLEIVESICRFTSQTVAVCPELIAEATRRFFAEV